MANAERTANSHDGRAVFLFRVPPAVAKAMAGKHSAPARRSPP